jgi:hypothetical protein
MNGNRRIIFKAFLGAILLSGLLASSSEAQSLWVDDGPRANLISSNVARKKGDILTIIILESQKVEDKQEVKLEKDTALNSVLESFNIDANAFQPLPDMIESTSKDFEGKSDYDKEGNFEARISVTVKDVLHGRRGEGHQDFRRGPGHGYLVREHRPFGEGLGSHGELRR